MSPSTKIYQADTFSATDRFIDFSEVQKYIPLSKSSKTTIFYQLKK